MADSRPNPTNQVPEGATYWRLIGVTDEPSVRFKYELEAEDDPGLTLYVGVLPEPGPHLVGDRFATHNGDIYVLA